MPSESEIIQRIAACATRLVQGLTDAEFWHNRWLKAATDEHHQRIVSAKESKKQKQDEAHKDYRQAFARLSGDIGDLLDGAGILAAPWNDPLWKARDADSLDGWAPAQDGAMPAVTYGGRLIEPGQNGSLDLPLLLPFPGERALLFKATGDAKDNVAIPAMQSIILRLLATIPPGKLRFTFLDPVGLGDNVAAFMHLADYDEALVTAKAWTEEQHIEQRLIDLSEHMETIIQKYLLGDYPTIQHYNAKAGEVAEPYRVLVVLDFPRKFSERAAERLVSIVQKGPRCGVYTIILNDTALKPPRDFNMDDLERAATTLAWESQHEGFVWQDADFRYSNITLDTPPEMTMPKEAATANGGSTTSDEQEPPEKTIFRRVITQVGAQSKDARRVEVPFERMFGIFAGQLADHPSDYPGLSLDRLPAPEDPNTWWGADTRSHVFALLGRAGASKIQCFDLGNDMAPHALVAGKTGSGKSTLLHILITSLAMLYSPDEIELYLIDFKQGVEFKSYAYAEVDTDHQRPRQLPHARVIAIESEREFGLSVLQALDGQLKERSDTFPAGAQSLTVYRQKGGSLPRILLLVDEFQEFFTEDDQIASQAKQILDRLVRQGRAFGIHVLLGSQTLAGAYSLPRSTMDQMAVRIALQCSEADSRLILGEDNPAARLLSRPGEAIYNAANGMVEGNNFFQVAWLPDERRDRYLEQVYALAQRRGYHRLPIVFEGNALASIEKNEQLAALLAAPTLPAPPSKLPAWLGDPIAIRREAMTATFRRQSGGNLLIVGQDEAAALGMMATPLLSLAAHLPLSPRDGTSLYVLDFGATEGPDAEMLELAAGAIPHICAFGRRRQLPQMLGALATEVQRRLDADDPSKGNGAGAPRTTPIFLFIHGLHRARDLRQDESLGYSSFGAEPTPPSPAQHFTTILREGPDVGVHTIIWCDTMTNLTRTLDRRALREFAMRVALQMSAEDSSNLIDTPAASKLKQYRALFYSEDEGRLEKFRPYAPPTADWLKDVEDKLQARAGSAATPEPA